MPGYDHRRSTQGCGGTTQPSAVERHQHGGQARLGNAEIQARMNAQSGACSETRLPSPVNPNGDLVYYRSRHDDFANRYPNCGLRPPAYYMGYGDKYVRRFTMETDQRLSPQGQAWLDRARVLFQVAIEDERVSDPAAFDRLERNDSAFTRFAYDTHPDAYWNAGLGDLSLFDLTNIGLTPDARDLFGWDGIVQVADIGCRLADTWGSNALDNLGGAGTAEAARDALVDAYHRLGDGVDYVFGEGTAAVLEDAAVETGNDLLSIGQSLHGYAGDAVGAAVEMSDNVFGEGTTEAVINDAGTVLSDGSDWVEERYKELSRWADDFMSSW